jgi:hypothetical protein
MRNAEIGVGRGIWDLGFGRARLIFSPHILNPKSHIPSMADFRTHVTCSGVLGGAYTVAGLAIGMPMSTSLVSGALCALGGMLPDIDSDSGIPRRESLGFLAAVVPMLLLDRFREWGLGHDDIVFATVAIYLGIRYIGAELLTKFTVHRGMFHSIPALLIFAGIAFLMCGTNNVQLRYFKAFAVFLGALSHLMLDELWSVEVGRMGPRLKKSFGSALKLFSDDPWANFSTYVKLALVGVAIWREPGVAEHAQSRHPQFAEQVNQFGQRVADLRAGQPQPLAPMTGYAPQQPYRPQGDQSTYDAARQMWAPAGS